LYYFLISQIKLWNSILAVIFSDWLKFKFSNSYYKLMQYCTKMKETETNNTNLHKFYCTGKIQRHAKRTFAFWDVHLLSYLMGSLHLLPSILCWSEDYWSHQIRNNRILELNFIIRFIWDFRWVWVGWDTFIVLLGAQWEYDW
jgi:hypothetical protein